MKENMQNETCENLPLVRLSLAFGGPLIRTHSPGGYKVLAYAYPIRVLGRARVHTCTTVSGERNVPAYRGGTGCVQGCVQGCGRGMIHPFSHLVDDERVNSLLLCFSPGAFFIEFTIMTSSTLKKQLTHEVLREELGLNLSRIILCTHCLPHRILVVKPKP